MKFLKQSIFYSLIALTLVGNAGVSVYTHLCKKDGISRSFFVADAHACKIQEEQKSLPSCCHKEKSHNPDQTKFESEKCCSEVLTIYQNSFDGFSSTQDHHFTSEAALFIGSFLDFVNCGFSPKFQENYSPPPLQAAGIELLIKHQVFRL